MKRDTRERAGHFRALRRGALDHGPVDRLLAELGRHLRLEELPPGVSAPSRAGPKLTEELTALPLRLVRGAPSWGGLLVGFPGAPKDLTTDFVGTPYLRRLLYPMLDLHRRLQDHVGERLPCLYLLGARFPDVLLRKFRQLAQVTPHVVPLTADLLEAVGKGLRPPSGACNEAWVQAWLCRRMATVEGLRVPVAGGELTLGYLARELYTGEGTRHPERLDILGVSLEDGGLVALEIKGPSCKRVELENLLFQGIEHRNWLEDNKMGLKLLLDGPRARRINTRKRVGLVVGFFQNEIPPLFTELRARALRRDPHLRIDFVRFRLTGSGEGEAAVALEGVDVGVVVEHPCGAI